MAKMQDEQYILLPCMGRERLGIPRGHLYKVKDREGNDLGFLTLKSAKESLGEENYSILDSDTLCGICHADANGELEEILLKDHKKKLGYLNQDKKTLIQAMNEKYLTGNGKLGPGFNYQEKDWTKEQREFGAQYALSLLDGYYIDPKTKQWSKFDQDNQMILERSLDSVMDLFQAGHGFLYAPDPFISDSKRKAVGRKVIEVIKRTEYTEERYIQRWLRYVILPGIRILHDLKSAKGTWLDPERPGLPYDKDATKRVIAELVPLIEQRFTDK
ncbi:hypothetical protein KY343_06310 [Candidatus Woesearchaeota archaeon]|nr:hypothetical protein [Candidatus Woesearchaeota archaeon]